MHYLLVVNNGIERITFIILSIYRDSYLQNF